MNTPHQPLRLNVGFLLGQTIGTSRDFEFDFPRIRLGEDFSLSDFSGTARFTRTPQGLFLQAKFQGNEALECVRCLDIADHQLKMDFSELYAFNQRSVSESGLLVPESGYIDLEPLVREYALLEVPINPLCKPGCKGLCRECGQNLNKKDCGHQQVKANDSFAKLESLLKANSD